MRFGLIVIAVLSIISAGCNQSFQDYTDTIDLSGTWKFDLDPDEAGLEQKWFLRELDDSVQLPGTTDENKKGIFLDERVDDRLSRVWYWKGAAWYQKEVDIPENWSGKNIQLLLERTKDTHVWLNDNYCGYENTLSAPQYFDLTKAVRPGKNKITILVDNAMLPPVGPSHAVDERTQTNWNGIVGRMELQATDPVWIDEVQLYPDIENNKVKVQVTIGNITNSPAQGTLTISAESWNAETPTRFRQQKETIKGISNKEVVEFVYNFNKEAPLWDEFDPTLIQLNLTLLTNTGDTKNTHSKQVDFGMREFKREGKYLTNNGERVFLRGRIDCANFPLTGYAPMDRDTWLHFFNTLKSYGINHWRFHSWFPPQEALMAADMVGVYLQPELPNKRSGMDSKSLSEEEVRRIHNPDYMEVDESKINMTLREYLQVEGELIFKYFGNHPSFTLFTLGNELGRNPGMFELIFHFQNIDPRRLYAQGSNNMHWEPSLAEGDDFWVISRTTTDLHVRGANFHGAESSGHVDNQPPSTMVDYSKSLDHVPVPVIGHESGAYQVSPDFNEISKYTGVTRARNFEIFRERLKDANMLDQADDFVMASGKLTAICYREEVEAALRTPDFAGFQLLDIMDFPGQGTAPVGILNVFMESKGLITPEEWSQFCSEVVPLLKMEKYTWTNNEIFSGGIEIAHYGREDFTNAEVNWKLINNEGRTLIDGEFIAATIPRGSVTQIGEMRTHLSMIVKAEKLQLVISIDGTQYTNKYDIWVYPESVDTSVPDGVLVSRRLDSKTKQHLENGGTAIIIPEHDHLPYSIRGAFQTDYWSYPMFLRSAINQGKEPAPGSLGFMCDPDSPLLKHFPTEFHSNWQWWQLVKNCRPIILDDTPADYRPLIQTIDNFARNHKLGMVFETKYVEGSALICAIDLPNLMEHPEARQLYYSLLQYADSDDFTPETELNREFLHKIIPN